MVFIGKIPFFCFILIKCDKIIVVGSKLAGKRPNKFHPFGFGRVEYLTNLFIGLLMVIVSSILLYNSFISDYEIPDKTILIILLIAITIKIIMITFLKISNKKIKSQPLTKGIEESTIDLISTILVTIAVILLQFSDKIFVFRYCDVVASLIISIMIFRTSWQLIKNNILNEQLNDSIKAELTGLGNFEIYKIELIKYGRYYKVHLVIGLDGDITLKKAKKVQQKIIGTLKQMKNIKIKVVNVDLDLRHN